jgi:DsbC/DsbD-like thiol-disulfide interchange protein
MTPAKWQVRVALAAAFALAAIAARGQSYGHSASPLKGEAVEFLYPEQVNAAAGRSTPVALHFRVAPGLHINSHTPSGDLLIPTVFSLPQGSGVRFSRLSYPAGAELTLPIAPKTKLRVYTGEFVIHARVVAARGDHMLQGKLHYQACNLNQCLPPKSIDVPLDVVAK